MQMQPETKPDFDAIRQQLHELVDQAVDVLRSFPKKRWPITPEMKEAIAKREATLKRKRAARKRSRTTR
jgi:hypothetical protein